MKVLAVTNMYPTPDRQGWGAFIASQIASLKAAGIEIDLIHIEGYKSKLNYLRGIVELQWKCLRNDYNLVHAHYGLSGLVARTQFHYPVVVSFCGGDLYGYPDRNGELLPSSMVWVWLHRHLSRMVDGVIVKSPAMNRLLPEPIATVIPNGVDFDLFRPLDRATCRRRLGLADDRTYVLFPYPPETPRKNYPLVKATVEAINADRPPPAKPLEILVVEGVAQEHIPVYMGAADVVMLVSFWEGSPNIIKEALACNMKIVASAVGDVPELINGVSGCRLCELTLDSTVAMLREVLADPAEPNGREAVAHLRLDRVAQQVIEVYRRVLDTRAPLPAAAPDAGPDAGADRRP